MIEAILQWQRERSEGPWVRPWGLAAPILVLIVCLPLLRPLRSVDVSENERSRLATVQAIVEYKTLAIDKTTFADTSDKIAVPPREGEPRGTRHFSRQPPVMAALLAGPYWVLYKCGLRFEESTAIVTYILTLLGVTLPVAFVAALTYRMGRLFELRRPWRMALAVATVFGSGLVSYATVLNSHAPAAALVMASAGALMHAAMARRGHPKQSWILLAGGCAATAAVIDFGAFVFLALFLMVIAVMRWPLPARMGAFACYALGALPALALHGVLTVPITGDFRPGFLHPELVMSKTVAATASTAPTTSAADEDEERPTWGSVALLHIADGLLGPRGLLSHFPLLLLGLGGMGAVLHRHWPAPTKALALVSLAGGIAVIAIYVTMNPDWRQPMFSVRWFIVFLPLVVFWSGAWLRRKHTPLMWACAAALLAFSVGAGLLGAAAPFTPAREGEYTLYAAARQLFRGSPAAPSIRYVAGT